MVVTLPLWFIILAGVLALIGLIDRLIMPSMRYFLRQRMSKAVDDLNTRLKLSIQPFKLTRRDSLVDRIIFDADLLKAVDKHAQDTGELRLSALARVKQYAREIVPNFNAFAYFRVGAYLARITSKALYKVRLGYSDEVALSKIDPQSTVVFVMNHRSNMDYVLVTYLAASSSALSYAVGEWAQVFMLRNIIRSMGAYFIRRESGDPLYRKVLSKYVQIATQEGVTQAVFPEGSLSRDGTLRPAKLGLLGYILGKYSLNQERDVVFIPVGLNYDRVIEDRNLTLGIAKREEVKWRVRGFKALSRYFLHSLKLRAQGKLRRLGYASVSFGEPFSMREHGVELRALDEKARFEEIQHIADILMARIGKVIPVLPVSLVATALLDASNVSMSQLEIKARAFSLVEKLKANGAHIFIPNGELDSAIEEGLEMLTLRHLVFEREGDYHISGDEDIILRYYANSIKHLLG